MKYLFGIHQWEAVGEEGSLVEPGEFTPTPVTFPNDTHVCEVEIHPDTGVTEIVRYSGVEELGRVLNPMIVVGQIHGGRWAR